MIPPGESPHRSGPPSAQTEAAPHAKASRDLLHPLAALTLLGLDWLVFTSGLLTGAMSLPVASVVAAGLATLVTLRLQRREGDSPWLARIKALAVGLLVVLPLPIAGSAVGGWVLGVSGLRRLVRR